MDIKIFVATPSMRPVNPWTYNSLMYSMWELGKAGVEIDRPMTYENYPLSFARNQIVEDFLKTDCTHLFMWDSDQVFHTGTLLRLLNTNKPIVSGFYLARNPERIGTLVVFNRQTRDNLCNYSSFNEYKPISAKAIFTLPPIENDGNESITQVDGVGLGCILIQREVFASLQQPYFVEWNPSMPADIHHFGEDLFFSDRLAQAGIPIYVNRQCFVGHEVTSILGVEHLQMRLAELGVIPIQ